MLLWYVDVILRSWYSMLKLFWLYFAVFLYRSWIIVQRYFLWKRLWNYWVLNCSTIEFRLKVRSWIQSGCRDLHLMMVLNSLCLFWSRYFNPLIILAYYLRDQHIAESLVREITRLNLVLQNSVISIIVFRFLIKCYRRAFPFFIIHLEINYIA